MKSLATHDYFRFNDLPGLRFVSGLPNMKLSTLLCYPFAGLKSKRSSKTMESSRHHLGQTDSLEHPFNDSFLLTSFWRPRTMRYESLTTSNHAEMSLRNMATTYIQ